MRMYNLDFRGLRLLDSCDTLSLPIVVMRMYNLDFRGLRLYTMSQG